MGNVHDDQVEWARAGRTAVLDALNATSATPPPTPTTAPPEFESLMLTAAQQVRLEAARIIAGAGRATASWSIQEIVDETLHLAHAIETGEPNEPTPPLRQNEPDDQPS